ncbi:MAG: hypothetical protein ACUVXA_01740 [Candidatus Jordarchaeum sp.]|uniref:hypothetical protein n=1 Tax=Candidatus Jordarchaeum sp. TaxID=2823881 RepID=UPI0040491F57
MKKHGFLSSEISAGIEDVLGGDPRLSEGVKFRRKEKGNSVIVTSNIYLNEKTLLSELVSYISGIVQKIIEKHLALDGEIIKLNIDKGTVSDRGEIWFEVVSGVIFEVYCFTCRSISFVRILHERQLYGEKNEWISLDMDECLDSQWFED